MDIDPQEEKCKENIQDQIANTFEAIPTNMKLDPVCEKQARNRPITALKFDHGGFPKAVRRDVCISRFVTSS